MNKRTREIGLITATALVIGNMVGSGIFLLPASLAPLGVYSLWGWVFSAGGALLLAWVFSRLSRRIARAGGPYAYPREAFGDFTGFLVAWMYWLALLATNAAIAVAFTSYLVVFFPAIATSPLLGGLVTVTLLWVLTGVNILGVRVAGDVQVVTVILKVSPLLLLAVFGAFYFDPHILASGHSSASPAASINTAAAFAMWAFLGLESATIPAGHVRNANKTIPRATLIGTVIAAIVYIASTTVVMGIIPSDSLAHSNAPFADAAQLLWGGWASYLIAAAALVSCFGALNGWVLMQGQLPQAVARDGLFPGAFATESRFGTPTLGLLLSSVLTTLLIFANYSHGLVHMFNIFILATTFLTLVPYMFCTMAEIVLARRDGKPARALWRNTLIACLAFVFALWAAAGTGQESIYWGGLLMLAGIPVYVWQIRHKRAADDTQPTAKVTSA